MRSGSSKGSASAHDVAEQIRDHRRRILSFAPGSIFAYVRWAANDFGTDVSRIDNLLPRALDANYDVRHISRYMTIIMNTPDWSMFQ